MAARRSGGGRSAYAGAASGDGQWRRLGESGVSAESKSLSPAGERTSNCGGAVPQPRDEQPNSRALAARVLEKPESGQQLAPGTS